MNVYTWISAGDVLNFECLSYGVGYQVPDFTFDLTNITIDPN